MFQESVRESYYHTLDVGSYTSSPPPTANKTPPNEKRVEPTIDKLLTSIFLLEGAFCCIPDPVSKRSRREQAKTNLVGLHLTQDQGKAYF